jgi:hypothetical protein
MELYFSLPSWLRTTVAVVVLGIGLAITIAGYANRPRSREVPLDDGRVLIEDEGGGRGPAGAFRVGMIVTGVGTVLLMLCGKSRAEKAGYNF